jgi:hypothetical protein
VSARVAARLGWLIFGFAVLLYAVALTLNLRRAQSPELSQTTGDLAFTLTFLRTAGWAPASSPASRTGGWAGYCAPWGYRAGWHPSLSSTPSTGW